MDGTNFINSYNFKDKKKINIKPSCSDQEFKVKSLSLGKIKFETGEIVKICSFPFKYKDLFTQSEFKPPTDHLGVWSFDPED